MVDHEMRPECAENFANLRARMDRGEMDDREVRDDIRRIHAKLDAGFLEVTEAIATLRERSRNWGIIGGLGGSLLVAIISAVILAVIL